LSFEFRILKIVSTNFIKSGEIRILILSWIAFCDFVLRTSATTFRCSHHGLPQRYPAIIGGNLPMGKYLKIARLQLLDQTGQQYGILKATAA
jgi:hypothetical protein